MAEDKLAHIRGTKNYLALKEAATKIRAELVSGDYLSVGDEIGFYTLGGRRGDVPEKITIARTREGIDYKFHERNGDSCTTTNISDDHLAELIEQDNRQNGVWARPSWVYRAVLSSLQKKEKNTTPLAKAFGLER